MAFRTIIASVFCAWQTVGAAVENQAKLTHTVSWKGEALVSVSNKTDRFPTHRCSEYNNCRLSHSTTVRTNGAASTCHLASNTKYCNSHLHSFRAGQCANKPRQQLQHVICDIAAALVISPKCHKSGREHDQSLQLMVNMPHSTERSVAWRRK